jgi:PhoH-like ATPase
MLIDTKDIGFNAIVSAIDGNSCLMKYPRDYFGKSHSVWGMTARNNEQNFAMNFLMNAEIDLVTLLGPAGTGKTLLMVPCKSPSYPRT